jgi:isopenicillin-N N-acyltransferase-like protein
MVKIIKVQGTHFECGQQLGVICREQLTELVSETRKQPPKNLSWRDCLDKAKPFIKLSQQAYPFALQEIEGAAKGANLDFNELAAASIEELWMKPFIYRACSDVVACPPTTNGTILVGHNNDLINLTAKSITAVEWTFKDSPKMFTIGVAGVFVGIGVNAKGIVLTGSELTPTDNKIGIPRGFIARAILNAGSFEEAVNIATDSRRASSYCNIISTKDPNNITAIEGSATDFERIYPEKGILIHTNHYITAKMKKYEGEPGYTSSIERQLRLEVLTQKAEMPITEEVITKFLRDHGENGISSDNTICRHGSESQTLFGCLMDLTNGTVKLALGNPCQAKFENVWKIC